MLQVVKYYEIIGRYLPSYIGGPGTRLPRFVESFLSWAFAVSCLGVALWHYQVDRYWTRISSGPTEIREGGKPQHRRERHRNRLQHRYRYKHRHCLPLTTHSRREWLTVSDSYKGLRTRYQQLLILICTEILATQTKLPNAEKKDDNEDEKKSLDDNEYVIVEGKTCHEIPERKQEDQPSSVGEVVAKWLSSGLVVSATLQTSPSKATPTTRSIYKNKRHFDDDATDSLHCRDSRERLIRLIRTNEAARRLASLLLGKDPIDATSSASNPIITTKFKTTNNKEKWLDRLSSEEPGAGAVLLALREIWPQLLELPAFRPPAHSNGCQNNTETIAISVIVPAFREDGQRLAAKLKASLENAIEPHRIEVIIVHVVEMDQHRTAEDKYGESSCDDLSVFAKTLREQLVSATTVEDSSAAMTCSRHPVLRILEYHGGGGRGPCLNYGAKHARGGILTFLHGDTRLATRGWDKAISTALEEDESGGAGPRTTCCAFSFAIDTSPEALTVLTKKSNDCGTEEESWDCCNESDHYQQYYPPGLRAIEVTANLRCKLFSLPYGDQCLSLPTAVFRYIGGYPDQCLMEDYELIRLLRMRSAVSLARPTSSKHAVSGSDQGQETIDLLPDHIALCSPRRWQKYGVLYVTYTNSYCVKRYNNGEVTPDELFCEYYGTQAPPNRMSGDRSPWEAEL